MRLKFVGMICPDCGDPVTYVSPLKWDDCWLGYVREVWCNCDTERHFEARAWLILFDRDRRFVGVVPGSKLLLSHAGQRVGEIPF